MSGLASPRPAGVAEWTVSRRELDRPVLVLSGRWTVATTREAPGEVASRMHEVLGEPEPFGIDCARLDEWDSLLVATLWRLRALRGFDPVELDLPPPLRRLLALTTSPGTDLRMPTVPVIRRSIVAHTGTTTLDAIAGLGGIAMLAGTLLRGLWPRRTPAGSREPGMQGRDLLDIFRRHGPAALPIIGLVNLLVGAILAFIGAAQLRRFGAQIFVTNLVGLALVRELGAVITAIVLCGRTGGAFAARLATMGANEELDALSVLGIDPRRFLVLPMTLALVIAMPLLYLYATAAGLLGGMLVAVNLLDLSASSFATQLVDVVPVSQFGFGLGKSVLFGLLIGLVSCRIGLLAGRSAAAVGDAATRAVVASIVGVIVLDSVCAVCADAVGL
ncbi:MlaE family ABC transporter permease [Rhizosaccharibacter radicis]|uniref:ABC transporter permease n=1 Tax=Rhizosaccharibacter radicis TaxID=2782605 RepID=A0ABT1W2X2_9PROT|nr:ABC transporter permease [Acetobacteraceae bacterium KSS12]